MSKSNKDKTVNVLAIFTEQMIADARKCKDAAEISKKIIEPNIAMIDEKTGQENFPLYWAYVMQHTIEELDKRNRHV